MPRLVTALPSVPENPEEFYSFTFVYHLGKKKVGEQHYMDNTSKMSSYIWRKLEASEAEVLEEDLYGYAQELGIPVPIIVGSIHATSPAQKSKKRHSVGSDQVDLSTISKVEGRLVGIVSTTDSDKKAHRFLYLRYGRRIKAFKIHLPSDPRPETYVSHDYHPGPGYIGLGSTRHYLNITKG